MVLYFLKAIPKIMRDLPFKFCIFPSGFRITLQVLKQNRKFVHDFKKAREYSI